MPERIEIKDRRWFHIRKDVPGGVIESVQWCTDEQLPTWTKASLDGGFTLTPLDVVEQGAVDKAYIQGWEDAVDEKDDRYNKLVWERRQRIIDGLTDDEKRDIIAINERYSHLALPTLSESLLEGVQE